MAGDWRPDPTNRHELRWHDGDRWTDHVADDGATATDPYDAASASEAPPGAPSTTARSAPPSASTAPSMAMSARPPQAARPSGSSGVATGWVVGIALVALVVGGLVGFFVGVAVDVGGEVTQGFEEGFSSGSVEDAVAGEPLALGASVSGQADDDGVAHPLELASSTTLQLETVSGDFDTVIDVYDADGNEVASDDDGGTDTLSSLSVSLDPGSYTVVVRPFAFGGGSYTLQATG